ncbi:response regulator transcription factor [Paenibacillus sanguinis]|uniref:response regulator transcription factor n=1 Tax=Paenibacillus sanguinis TaxID=225906 RepID=UPI000381EA55|nr:response regulator [Paenibacillus sanguinis]
MQLLIVDDGQHVVEYLKHLLDWRAFGIDHIETTTNSIEARDMLSRSPVDILITDIRMPEVTGIDLLQHIHENSLPTKVIFLSGYSQFDYAQQGLRLGALDYLLKPVDKDDMETAMAKAVARIHEKRPVLPASGKPFDGLGYLLSLLGENRAARKEFAGYESAVEQIPNHKHLSNQSIVAKVQAYIENHLDHSLSLDELGKIAHLHPVYLSKLFKQATAENVSSYISRKRLEKASRLLLDSELRVSDISQMVGYKKNQYFIQLFKEKYGVTPYQYRRTRLM